MDKLPLFTDVDFLTKLLSSSVFLDLKNTEVVRALLSLC
jgi:small nuclear ribonucleoprotein (snRNP)-like protein